jgi:phosphohistidine phosphatase
VSFMQIILIRHGQAESLKTTDEARALTADGEFQAQQTAAWLVNQGYQLDALIVSPYVRAQQTAYHVAQAFDLPMTVCDKITPDDDPKQAFEWLDELSLPDSAVVAVVCHMPIVARLAMLLRGESVAGFDLAEVQVLDMPMFALGMASVSARFIPN